MTLSNDNRLPICTSMKWNIIVFSLIVSMPLGHAQITGSSGNAPANIPVLLIYESPECILHILELSDLEKNFASQWEYKGDFDQLLLKILLKQYTFLPDITCPLLPENPLAQRPGYNRELSLLKKMLKIWDTKSSKLKECSSTYSKRSATPKYIKEVIQLYEKRGP